MAQSNQRIALASAVAPSIPAIVLTIFASTPSYYTNVIVAGFALVFGYAGFLVLGLPAITLLRRIGLLSLPSVLVSGAIFGVLVLYLSLLALGYLFESSGQFDTNVLLWGAGFGSAVALCYGLIAGLPWRSKRTAA